MMLGVNGLMKSVEFIGELDELTQAQKQLNITLGH